MLLHHSNIDTRGHNYFITQFNIDVVTYSLFNIIAKIKNSLPSYIVTSPNCYTFNKRLTDSYSLPFLRGRAINRPS